MIRIPNMDRSMLMAVVCSTGSTCYRRRVGCVLTNSIGHVLSTGFNGVPSASPHCIDTPCAGNNLPSGQGLDLCEAVHAETNALLQCRDVFSIESCYVTTAPCVSCVKSLMNTSCRRIVFIQDYPHSSASKKLWENSGRTRDKVWIHYYDESLPGMDEVIKFLLLTSSMAMLE